jgi:hypothetical protein
MSIELQDDELDDLGIGREELGDPAIMKLEQEGEHTETAESFEPRRDEGPDNFLSRYVRDKGFEERRTNEWLEAAGLSLKFRENRANIAIVKSHRGQLRSLEVLGDGDPSTILVTEDASNALVDLDRIGAIVAHLHGGDRLVLRKGVDKLAVWCIASTPIEPPSPPDVRPPVESWIESNDLEPWLGDLVDMHLEVDDNWNHVVAAGLYKRLHRGDSEEESDFLQSLLDAEMETPSDPVGEWASGLEPDQIEAIQEAARRRVGRVHDRIEKVLEHVDPDDDVWRGMYLDMLHARDDLASVREILLAADAEAAEALDGHLRSLDQRGRRVVRSLPSVHELHDDARLIRASTRNPDAWWIEPAVEETRSFTKGDPERFVPAELRRELDSEDREERGPGALFVVDQWETEARDTLALWTASEGQRGEDDRYFEDVARDGLDLVASWGALTRMRPTLVDTDLLDRIEARIRDDRETLLDMLEHMRLLDGWLEEAQSWEEQMLEASPDAQRRASVSLDLLCRLDKAALAIWAYESLHARTGSHPRRERLEQTHQWCRDHAPSLTGASRYVEPLLRACRDDLDTYDFELDRTMEPFVHVAEAIERQRQWREGEEVDDIDARIVETWRSDEDEQSAASDSPRSPEDRRRSPDERSPRQSSTGDHPEPPPLPEYTPSDVAAAPNDEGDEFTQPQGRKIDWYGPEESWRATLHLPEPERASDDREAVLDVLGHDEAVAVRLYGLEGSLSDSGEARFKLGELRDVWGDAEQHSLEVIDKEGYVEIGRLGEP